MRTTQTSEFKSVNINSNKIYTEATCFREKESVDINLVKTAKKNNFYFNKSMEREMLLRPSTTVNINIVCILPRYLSLNAILTQSKNCYFGVNTIMELQNIAATSDNSGI
jgi:hypothetical protein